MFVVEPARSDDAKGLAVLASEALSEPFDSEWWNATLASESCFVARDTESHELVGFAVAHREPACEAELSALAVDKQRRGQGIGAALLHTVQSRLRAAGTFQIHLEVRDDDAQAKEFYARHGYAPDGLVTHAFSDGASAVRMRRPI